MKYMLFPADYNLESCLRDEFSGMPATCSTYIPAVIRAQISNWQQKYWTLMMNYTQDEVKCKDEFEKLDHEGIAIAEQIVNANNGHIKVQYYSERFFSYKMLN